MVSDGISFIVKTSEHFLQGGELNNMKNFKNIALKLRILKDTRGQDLIEYALMAGFVAVAAGAIMPNVATSISTIFSKIGSVMTNASGTGS